MDAKLHCLPGTLYFSKVYGSAAQLIQVIIIIKLMKMALNEFREVGGGFWLLRAVYVMVAILKSMLNLTGNRISAVHLQDR